MMTRLEFGRERGSAEATGRHSKREVWLVQASRTGHTLASTAGPAGVDDSKIHTAVILVTPVLRANNNAKEKRFF